LLLVSKNRLRQNARANDSGDDVTESRALHPATLMLLLMALNVSNRPSINQRPHSEFKRPDFSPAVRLYGHRNRPPFS
jgi:hypothetical protein